MVKLLANIRSQQLKHLCNGHGLKEYKQIRRNYEQDFVYLEFIKCGFHSFGGVAFPKNLHTRKSGEILVFFAVI